MTDPKFDMESTIPESEVPVWARGMDWTGWDVKAVAEHGCGGGTYMPAVTYHEALETMAEHGDDIFDYIDVDGDPSELPLRVSWSGMACYFVSRAVELWAGNTMHRIESGDFDPEASTCPDCNGQAPANQDGQTRDCRRCDGTGEVFS